MKVSGMNTAANVTPAELAKPKKKATQITQKPADSAQQTRKSAERLAKAIVTRFIALSLSVLTAVWSGYAAADMAPLLGEGASGPPAAPASSGGIMQIPCGPCPFTVDFSDVVGGDGSGTNYDGIVTSGGVEFAEKFVGQVLSANGNFDVLTCPGSVGALTLGLGLANQNLSVVDFGGPNNGLLGNGPTGYPNFSSIGEGSVAVLFSHDVSKIGFDVVGATDAGGNINICFYERDGTLIGTATVAADDTCYLWMTQSGQQKIAGISLANDDFGGVGYDNFCFDSSSTATGIELPVQDGPQIRVSVHPNPTRQRTTVFFRSTGASLVEVFVYKISGQLVRKLVDGRSLPAGERSITWDGRNDSGAPVGSGVYFIQIRDGRRSHNKKVLLVR